MNDDAGNGGTRLAAAKKAVGTLVDRLPEGVPLGLRVYGSKVSEASRAEGCRDTELTVPVGPLDKAALRAKVDALEGKGRTPIGNSLLAVPDDLGSAEGRRSVVLVTDGGDNCAPPSPCKAAEQVAKRGVDLSISVVGFQVNDRVRKQLRCIAEAGGGSYVDVDDADKLGDELLALARARVPVLRADRDQGHGRGDPRAGDGARRRAVPRHAAPGRLRALVLDRRARGPSRDRVGDRDPAARLERARRLPGQAVRARRGALPRRSSPSCSRIRVATGSSARR